MKSERGALRAKMPIEPLSVTPATFIISATLTPSMHNHLGNERSLNDNNDRLPLLIVGASYV